MMSTRLRLLFVSGDCAAAALTAAAVTLAVRAVIAPGWDMLAAMIAGMGIGMLVHLGLGLALSPLLGMFETMVPGMIVGMYGGMLFGMRRSMQDLATVETVLSGAAFGVLVALFLAFLDAQVRRRSSAGLAAGSEG